MKCENCGSPTEGGLAYCEDIEDCFATLQADVQFLQGKLNDANLQNDALKRSVAVLTCNCGAALVSALDAHPRSCHYRVHMEGVANCAHASE